MPNHRPKCYSHFSSLIIGNLLLFAQPMYSQNGISVGDPKVFDNRSLTLMLDTLNQQLQSMQVIDQTKLAAALGNTQGFQTQETLRAFTAQASIPFKVPGNPDAPAGTTPPSVSVPNLAPIPWNMGDSAAGLPTGITSQTFGQSAGDTLSDQVNLTYQIFNIRMLLERSLSDRLIKDITGPGKPRLQAVLGFNVSLDPPRDAIDSAAIVEITIKSKDGRVNLVGLMPQEKTYNAATLSTKSTAFGMSAAAKLVTVGFSERRKGQIFYLYRDNDTLAVENMSNNPDLTFGWQFRPVLGRRSVASGMRQMFAIVSLPTDNLSTNSDGLDLDISVKTHWRKYYRTNQTTAEGNKLWFWDIVGHVAGLGFPQAFPPSKVDKKDFVPALHVFSTKEYSDDLSPRVHNVYWTWLDKKNMLFSLEGENFFKDTRVAFGGRIFDSPATGLSIKSDQAMDILVSSENGGSLVIGDGVILGRYGPAQPIQLTPTATPIPATRTKENEPDLNPTCQSDGSKFQLVIDKTSQDPTLEGFYSLQVTLARGDKKHLCIGDLPLRADRKTTMKALSTFIPLPLLDPILAINETLISGPYTYAASEDNIVLDKDNNNKKVSSQWRVILSVVVSVDAVKSLSGLLTVRYPFLGNGLFASRRIYDPDKTIIVSRLNDVKDVTTILALKNNDPAGWLHPVDKKWQAMLTTGPIVLSDKCTISTTLNASPNTFCRASEDVAILTVNNKDLMTGNRLLLTNPCDGVLFAQIPPLKEEPTPARKPIEVNQFDSVRVKFEALDLKPTDAPLNTITSATADGSAMEFQSVKDGIEVLIKRTLSKKPGNLDIFFKNAKSEVVAKGTVIIKCTECSLNEKKEN